MSIAEAKAAVLAARMKYSTHLMTVADRDFDMERHRKNCERVRDAEMALREACTAALAGELGPEFGAAILLRTNR